MDETHTVKHEPLVLTMDYKFWSLMSKLEQDEYIDKNNIDRIGYTFTGNSSIPQTIEFWK